MTSFLSSVFPRGMLPWLVSKGTGGIFQCGIAPSPPKNVLFPTVDDLRSKRGRHGKVPVLIPKNDRLACGGSRTNGVRF